MRTVSRQSAKGPLAAGRLRLMNRARPFGLTACAAAYLALSGCQTVAQRVADKEDLLAAAGFTVQPANNPKRVASLHTLPSNTFVPHNVGDRVKYVYADPIVCNCLYVGDQAAFDAYKKEVFTRNIVSQQEVTAETYSEQWNWAGWDWSPWGPEIW
jgi:hypothetical protein